MSKKMAYWGCYITDSIAREILMAEIYHSISAGATKIIQHVDENCMITDTTVDRNFGSSNYMLHLKIEVNTDPRLEFYRALKNSDPILVRIEKQLELHKWVFLEDIRDMAWKVLSDNNQTHKVSSKFIGGTYLYFN